MSYWSNPDNREGYSASEQETIAKRIVAAAKEAGKEAGKEVDLEHTIGKLAGIKTKKEG